MLAGSMCIFTSGMQRASAQTTTLAPTTTTGAPTTTTFTFPPAPISGQSCEDSLSCQRVTAQDVSRLRTEVATALFLLVLFAGAMLMVLVAG
ncbi:MAG: hypothetical protein ACYDH6_16040 [Acidimicrobiales bacterium]